MNKPPSDEENELAMCPFDESHLILKSRFQVHIVRCSQNRKVNLVTCPFACVHKVNKSDLESHVKVCEFRKTFDSFKHRDAAAVSSIPPPEERTIETVKSDENWDEEPDVQGYNPQQHVKQSPVLRNLQGKSKSIKKQFRGEERLRLMNIEK